MEEPVLEMALDTSLFIRKVALMVQNRDLEGVAYVLLKIAMEIQDKSGNVKPDTPLQV